MPAERAKDPGKHLKIHFWKTCKSKSDIWYPYVVRLKFFRLSGATSVRQTEFDGCREKNCSFIRARILAVKTAHGLQIQCPWENPGIFLKLDAESDLKTEFVRTIILPISDASDGSYVYVLW